MCYAASEGMLKWLKAPTLPRPFVLDLLDFVLANSAAVFRYQTTVCSHVLRCFGFCTAKIRSALSMLATALDVCHTDRGHACLA